jgi:ATP-dependent Clp protease adapter protein ClpS
VFASHQYGRRRSQAPERAGRDQGTAVITKTKPQTKRPNMYRVLILNDDYTPMEFVVHVLERFFGKDHEAATRIMLHVHHHGIGECGVYTYEGRRNQGHAGHGLCAQTSASFAMRDGKKVSRGKKRSIQAGMRS